MGCGRSKVDTEANKSNSLPINWKGTPPVYHSQACETFREWRENGRKISGYSVVVHYLDAYSVTQIEHDIQETILRAICEAQQIHDFDVKVKCLNRWSEEPQTGNEKNRLAFLRDLDSYKTFTEVSNHLDNCSDHKDDGAIQPIVTTAEGLKAQAFISDSDSLRMLKPDIQAAIYKYNSGWDLGTFMSKRLGILEGRNPGSRNSALMVAAQFQCLLRGAKAVFESHAATPTIHIVFAFKELPEYTRSRIHRELGNAVESLQKMESESRQDAFAISVIALDAIKSKWQKLDDAYRGKCDFIDHTPVSSEILSGGPGPLLLLKILLGGIDADVDRKMKNGDMTGLYGKGCRYPKAADMWECTCLKPRQKAEPSTSG
ncbi:hypothetical protein K469DRAFT_719105 [Zopfia rhizophila CBS 207.26]|uniref:Uncharacterized protein n=1 Tax=Zopfia rhizophila CBS 207.26 TaxID=1314779 RepID=A0A6A6EL62_9PEZI|nr:hypothetical protein K469DRAFT_719105 [Zopfia rhizophila CBS 207.26]